MKIRLMTLIVAIFAGLGLCPAQSEIIVQNEAPKVIPVKAQSHSNTDGSYRLIIKQLPNHPISDTIYGQISPDLKGFFGGDYDPQKSQDRLKERIKKDNPALKEMIDSGQLTIVKDRVDGIILSLKEEKAPETLDICLSGAKYKDKKDGWCADDNVKYLITWDVKKLYTSPSTTDAVTSPSDIIGDNDDPAEEETGEEELEDLESQKDSAWSYSDIDVILGLLILILTGYIVYLSIKINRLNRQPDIEKEKKINKLLVEVSNTVIQQNDAIARLSQNYQGLSAEIAEQKSLINRLNNALFNKPQTISQPKKNHYGAGSAVNTNVAMKLGTAQAAAGQHVLELSNNPAALFEITRNPNGSLTFSLREDPEARAFFESNASMLSIYKAAGIINFTEIPANSHVKVKTAGTLVESGNGIYTVNMPLDLLFE